MSDLLVRSLGETIEVSTAAEDGLWTALADPSQVENALLHLAINARDAMPDGGKLTIECSNAQLDQDYIASNPGLVAGDYVLLAVSDNGVGMSAEVQAQAFDPFFTTKEVGHGSGLGLSMIYGFAKQSGGHVKIYSEEGHGTTMKLYLPRSDSPAAAQATVEHEILRGKNERVLVVEDDPRVRELAVEMLQNLGYRVIGVPDAVSGRAVLERGDKIDLVLSDVVLPGGVSGPALVQEMMRQHPALKVVFMSGYPAEAAMRNGFVGSDKILLNKPFRRHQLATALREAFDRS